MEGLADNLRVDLVALNTGVDYGVEATGGGGDAFVTFFPHNVLTDLARNLPAFFLDCRLDFVLAIFDRHQDANRFPSLDTASLSRYSPGGIFSDFDHQPEMQLIRGSKKRKSASPLAVIQ